MGVIVQNKVALDYGVYVTCNLEEHFRSVCHLLQICHFVQTKMISLMSACHQFVKRYQAVSCLLLKIPT